MPKFPSISECVEGVSWGDGIITPQRLRAIRWCELDRRAFILRHDGLRAFAIAMRATMYLRHKYGSALPS